MLSRLSSSKVIFSNVLFVKIGQGAAGGMWAAAGAVLRDSGQLWLGYWLKAGGLFPIPSAFPSFLLEVLRVDNPLISF